LNIRNRLASGVISYINKLSKKKVARERLFKEVASPLGFAVSQND
jgi:hypothetical protein